MSYPVTTAQCPACGTATKLLLSSTYCPRDCDRALSKPPMTRSATEAAYYVACGRYISVGNPCPRGLYRFGTKDSVWNTVISCNTGRWYLLGVNDDHIVVSVEEISPASP